MGEVHKEHFSYEKYYFENKKRIRKNPTNDIADEIKEEKCK
jgi:hypothetical protein